MCLCVFLSNITKHTICQLFCSCVYSSHCKGQKVESGSKVKSDDSEQHQVSVQLRNPSPDTIVRQIPANGPLHSIDSRGGGGGYRPERDHTRASHTLSTSPPLHKTWRSTFFASATRKQKTPWSLRYERKPSFHTSLYHLTAIDVNK